MLQIINPRKYNEYLKKMRKSADHARSYFASAMIAATFAEAGEHETAREIMSTAHKNLNRLLPESEKAGVEYHYSVKSGTPDKEIIGYVNAHRDVVVAIYDSGENDQDKPKIIQKKKTTPGRLRHKLAVPLVVINS